MKASEHGYKVIQDFEGLRLYAYNDTGGIPTIGYGNTQYADGSKVKIGDKITNDQATILFETIADKFADKITPWITSIISQNQFDALLSFAYNIGTAAFKNSTLLRKVNENPADPSIRQEFSRWNKVNGSIVTVLTNRRKKEADLYFSKD